MVTTSEFFPPAQVSRREGGLMPEPRDASTPGDNQSADELVPEVYAELRRLAVALTTRLRPGQTLQATALVHEAYLRLVERRDHGWEGRRHFFGAAARAMREILIEQARRKASRKRGGGARRVELSEGMALIEPPADDLLALDEAIKQLQAERPHLAEIVLLRYYTGLSVEETAGVVDRSVSTVTREWRFARAWLAARVSLTDEG
jgi:RNA polymerase sigma factor (TIGR02999 family)